MVSIGVFYLPDISLEEDIKSLKSFFEKKSTHHKYLNHIVHSTFYAIDIDIKNLDNLLIDFENLSNDITNIHTEIKDWIIFENDILTNLNTLCLKIDFTNELKNLQKVIVKSLFKYHIPSKNENFKGKFLKSNLQYGFPFVGKHWIPHLTIGSLDINSNSISKYCGEMFKFPRQININNLCLFRLERDTHELIKKIKF